LDVHPDRVEKVDDRIIIDAAREMPDWVVSPHRPTVITYMSKTYIVDHKKALEVGRFEYGLTPVQLSDLNIPGRCFIYDQAFVDAREEAILDRHLAAPRDILLAATSPLVGFLWSGKTDQLESTGFDSWGALRMSLVVERFILLLLSLATAGEIWLGFIPVYLFIFDVLIALDIVLRTSALMDAPDSDRLGFLEYLNPKRYMNKSSN
jgi:hypothetical protein